MRTIYLSELQEPLEPCVATVGFFDGVHRGHQYLISQMKAVAAEACLKTTVVTFATHPRQVLDPSWQPQLLTTLSEKTALLSELGIDNLVVLEFDRLMSLLTAREFMVLLNHRVGTRVLITGYDNRFGHKSNECFDDYVRYGTDIGMRVVLGKPFLLNDLSVSSSKVRHFLAHGDVEMAASCLGRPYVITGCVVEGRQVGRQLGFPTANIACPAAALKLIPAPGVYGVRVKLQERAELLPGMMNIGVRPTFADGADSGISEQTLEVHIFDYDGDLYGQEMQVTFILRLRAEQKFDTQEQLVAQLQSDASDIRKRI